jgi:hypothetical protein
MISAAWTNRPTMRQSGQPSSFDSAAWHRATPLI